MTTKPKVQRYRIRPDQAPGRKTGRASAIPAPEAPQGSQPAEPNVEAPIAKAPTLDEPVAKSETADRGSTTPTPPEQTAEDTEKPATDIDAIRAEGLSGRQLRMARRIALKQGLVPESDYEAVKLLREQGIDPFKRANMFDLVVGRGDSGDAGQAQTSAGGALAAAGSLQSSNLPTTAVMADDFRADEIGKMQRAIARRRRWRAALLSLRLLFFVGIPTAIAGYYYFDIATPMYATKSEFVIQQANSPGAGQMGAALAGTGFANSKDSITVQGHLLSREAMLRLDEDIGFKSHFAQDDIDPLKRLEDDASNEEAYKLYKRSVKVGFDPSEGVIKMEVIAADPETSVRFAEQLIGYAEQRVDEQTARLRADQMDGANQSRIEANEKMLEAQQRVVELQERLGVLSPESEVQAVFAQISQLETELLSERLSLRQYLQNARPNEARVNATENKIAELERLISEKRAELTQSTSDSGSLARVSGELLVAQSELETRQGLLAQAESHFEDARLEANRQVLYLSVGVNPVAPDEPTYPRKFENTLLAFLIFSGIYLMVSLTASILREQV